MGRIEARCSGIGRWASVVFCTAALAACTGPTPDIPCGPPITLASESGRAFPGARGAGAWARGGRGGDVYAVTNLRDAGPGSLRFGIESARGPRTIVFEVAGNIELESDLVIRRPFLTLAGQSAPGGGITLAGRETRIQDTSHVVVRYLRFRPGDRDTRPRVYEPDALSVKHSEDVILDHVSASWATDEVLSITHGSDRVTAQWSIVAEALDQSNHHKGAHGYGSLIRAGEVAFLHNLLAHNRSRNPRPGSAEEPLRLSFVGNVIYNPGEAFGYGGDDDFELDYVANTGIAGPDTTPTNRRLFLGGGARNRIHQHGNRIDLARSGPLAPEPALWRDFGGIFMPSYRPFGSLPALPGPAEGRLDQVLTEAGASRWRDPVDERIVDSVRQRGGRHIDSQAEVGGWPSLPAGMARRDTDRDGLPDDWERAHCLDPTDPADAVSDPDRDGFTLLEVWLHERSQRRAEDAGARGRSG